MRQKLMQFATRKLCDQIDIPQISLGLLNSIFKSDFVHEKSFIQWKNRQVKNKLVYCIMMIPFHLEFLISIQWFHKRIIHSWLEGL